MSDLFWALLQILEACLAVIGAGFIALIWWFESDCKESAARQKEMFEEYEDY